MKTVLWWAIAGAATPAALLMLTFIPVALATGIDSLASNIGSLLLTLIMIVPPGAIGGAIIGLIDHALSRYVISGVTAASRRARALPAAFALFALVTGLTMILLRFTATDMTNVALNLAVAAAVAAIPAVIAYLRYSRLAAPAPQAPIARHPGT